MSSPNFTKASDTMANINSIPIPKFYCTFCDQQVYTTISRILIQGVKRLVRCCTCCNEIIAPVPAPRLVGIEPNPGPPRKNKKSRTVRRSKDSRLLVTNQNANPFRSVIRALDEKDNSQTYRHRLVSSGTIGGSVTGVNINLPLGGVGSALDWTNFSTLYDEFRVLGLRVHYQPHSRYTTASVGDYWYYDNDNTSLTPSSNNIAASYANSMFSNTSMPSTFDGIFAFTQNGPEAWYNCSTPTAQPGMVGLFTTYSLGTTLTIGSFSTEYIVEFRGRR
jgi:hypothetical protein